MRTEQISENLRQQAELYGQPLGTVLRAIMRGLGLTQARTAEVLGLSAPMLSQLISGQRVKIGNPQVVQRLQHLGELAEAAESLSPGAIEARLKDIKGTSTGVTTMHRAAGSSTPDPAAVVHRLLRAVASGRDLIAAAERIEAEFPEIAEILRVYGTGDPGRAKEHYAGIEHLL